MNVITNPDFSLLDGPNIAYWSVESWEPLLSIGLVNPGGDQATPTSGRGVRVAIKDEGRNELGLYPGFLYSGPGFDAGPGDAWQISFTHQWAASTSFDFGLVLAGVNNCSLFFRYGVTLWNEATQHWDAWYESLPIHQVIQPTHDIGGASPIDGPGPIPYVESFVIPPHFPTATYQFAICFPPNPHSQAQWDSPTANKAFKMQVYLNDVDLEQTSDAGSASAGSSPGDSFYSFWPTPRFKPGSPGPEPPPYGPEGGGFDYDVGLEWDQFQLGPAYPLQVVVAPAGHLGSRPWVPGMLGVAAMYKPPFFTVELDWVYKESHNPPDGSLWPTEYVHNIPGLVPLPPTATDDFDLSAPGISDPFTNNCGSHRTQIPSFYYMVVGYQNYTTSGIFGGFTRTPLTPAIMTFLHPEIRPLGGPLFLSQNFTKGIDQEFDYNLPCEVEPEVADVKVWARF